MAVGAREALGAVEEAGQNHQHLDDWGTCHCTPSDRGRDNTNILNLHFQHRGMWVICKKTIAYDLA